MRAAHFEAFGPVCPTCRSAELAHLLHIAEVVVTQGEHIVQGVIRCTNPRCMREYPILDGVPMLVAGLRQYVENNLLGLVMRDDLSPLVEGLLGDCAGSGTPYDVHRQHLSHYSADHWGDLDPELPPAERAKAGGVVRLLSQALNLLDGPVQGPVLDLGCSVGRSSFELAARTDGLVLGIDLNFSMLRVASQVLREGRVSYSRRRTGLVYDRRAYPVDLPGAERVDFWQCDVLALPLLPDSAQLLLSLNLLDCLSAPMEHLHQIHQLLRPKARALLATPYDWSAAATQLESWLGGHSQRGPDGGMGDATLRRVLPFAGLELVAELPEAEWAVRLHDRSTVMYLSHLMLLRPENPA